MLTQTEDRLSTIQRWALIRTIQKQSVMEHTARVAMIALRLAREYWQIKNDRILRGVLEYALYHDELEGITGDFPKMAKPYVDEGQAIADHIDFLHVTELKPEPFHIKHIVKCADYIEALQFLTLEVEMGNHAVWVHRDWLNGEFEKYLEGTPDTKLTGWIVEWMEEHWPHGFGTGSPKFKRD